MPHATLLTERLELVPITVAVAEAVILGRRDGSTIGGHLKRGIVYPTLEMHLTTLEHELVRRRDEATGLDLIR